MSEIYVLRVDKQNKSVQIRVLNAVLTFQKKDKKINIVNRYHISSQIYDPESLYLPRLYFAKACAIAGAILNDENRFFEGDKTKKGGENENR